MLALQRRTTPPQKIKSLFGTVLTTHRIDIVSLPISTAPSPSHLHGVRGKAPQDKQLFSPHPTQSMLGKPDSEGWADSELLYLSLNIIIIIIYVSPKICGAGCCPCASTAPAAALARRSPAFSQPGTGRRWLRGRRSELAVPAPALSTTCPNHLGDLRVAI